MARNRADNAKQPAETKMSKFIAYRGMQTHGLHPSVYLNMEIPRPHPTTRIDRSLRLLRVTKALSCPQGRQPGPLNWQIKHKGLLCLRVPRHFSLCAITGSQMMWAGISGMMMVMTTMAQDPQGWGKSALSKTGSNTMGVVLAIVYKNKPDSYGIGL